MILTMNTLKFMFFLVQIVYTCISPMCLIIKKKLLLDRNIKKNKKKMIKTKKMQRQFINLLIKIFLVEYAIFLFILFIYIFF